MTSQLLTLVLFAIGFQHVLSCCGPEKWEGLEGVSTGNMINGTGGAGQVCFEKVFLFNIFAELNTSFCISQIFQKYQTPFSCIILHC